ncbi:hypothetical protein BDQ94DRAFT_87599 [Aspergillus welwitschiae]|uniref:Uncharacterized protein n=1 Tax=Aspergillus welwitschiae TaxID=1341132 RepID=A0A3F3PQE4_9EURO|nr:uncharacterized protein BO96DRAFT_416915 [Aspergillus niger CBS 101883]XP_026622177.1 hypothetical protein BDQ94DRAFT_87599 [Aspergillus welwitschiae]PYH50654.1 hypothetical protein BO96DRAFT_416915 [Aspergillus niger CBS 101883]RDH29155.1 hypothetical protein BDQ94DRAFT_87599 [Aspergillus welwitschiae]
MLGCTAYSNHSIYIPRPADPLRDQGPMPSIGQRMDQRLASRSTTLCFTSASESYDR